MKSLITAFLLVVLGSAFVCAQAPAQTPSVNIAGAAEVTFWQTIVNSTNPQDFQDYLATFPQGAFVILAKRKLAMFQMLNLDGTIWSGRLNNVPVLFVFTGGSVYWETLRVYNNRKHPEKDLDQPEAVAEDGAQVAAGRSTFDQFADKWFAGRKARANYTTTPPNALDMNGYDNDGCTGPGVVFAGTVSKDTIAGSYSQETGTGSFLFGNPCAANKGTFDLKRLNGEYAPNNSKLQDVGGRGLRQH